MTATPVPRREHVGLSAERSDKSRCGGRVVTTKKWRTTPLLELRQGNLDNVTSGNERRTELIERLDVLTLARRRALDKLGEIDLDIAKLLEGLSQDERMEILFSVWASSYNDDMLEHGETVRTIIEKFRANIVGEVLDLSVGTGLVPDAIKSFSNVTSVLVNDRSLAMLKVAKQELADYPKPLTFSHTDATIIRVGTSVDSVFLSQTLHLLSNDKKRLIIQSAAAELRAGGNLFLIDEWPHQVPPVRDVVSALLASVAHPIALDELRHLIRSDAPELVEREEHIVDIRGHHGDTKPQMVGLRFEKVG